MIDVVTPESLLAVKQKIAGVTAICDTLPNKQRRALLLKEYDGLSYMEISAILGCTPKYAKKLVWKAKRTIREEMNDK
jgi:RNA polymerase sigma-70 factor (ECF subfamily)